MFECTNDSKVYVVCPAAEKTGGLELLHQLVDSLNNVEISAKIAYIKIPKNKPTINSSFKCYVNEFVKFENIEDSEKNIVIISEHRIELMDHFKKAKVAIWWLSVDNYLKVYDLKTTYAIFGFKGVAWYTKNQRWNYTVQKINKQIKYNLVQSYYAKDYLQKNHFANIEMLSDYISKDYLSYKMASNNIRKDVVLYNPKKGVEFSEYLMKLDTSISWVPLVNLTNIQVRELFVNSKVYVDFGNHPGKDRIPRETAYCGCCVITGKRGSAKFYKDVSIPDKYKFDDIKINGQEIIDCIKDIFENYDDRRKDFQEYRNIIKEEYDQFNADIKKIFVK